MHADRGIGHAGAAGDHTDPRLPRQLAPGCRHEGSATLVAAVHKIKPVFRVMQRIQHRKIAFARHAEGLGRPQCQQAVHQHLSAVSFHCIIPFLTAPNTGARQVLVVILAIQAGSENKLRPKT